MTNKMYVGNLNFSVNESDLRELFKEYGTVVDVKLITDKYTGKSKGFAFITMETKEEAQKAIEDLKEATLEGRPIKVSEAKEQRRQNRDRNW